MQPRLLLAIFDSVYLVALTSWLGAVLFFSFGVAPVIFRTLGTEAGGRFVRALFPRYYTWGVVCSAVCLPAFLGAPLSFPEYKGLWVGVQALGLVATTLIFLYCGNSLTPAINAARDLGASGAERFQRLHRRSVRLNSLVLVIGLALLVTQASRRPPRTAGIRELTPVQRLEYERQFQETLEDIVTKGSGRSTLPPAKGDDPDEPRFDEAARAELEALVAAKRERETRRRGGAAIGTKNATSHPPDRP